MAGKSEEHLANRRSPATVRRHGSPRTVLPPGALTIYPPICRAPGDGVGAASRLRAWPAPHARLWAPSGQRPPGFPLRSPLQGRSAGGPPGTQRSRAERGTRPPPACLAPWGRVPPRGYSRTGRAAGLSYGPAAGPGINPLIMLKRVTPLRAGLEFSSRRAFPHLEPVRPAEGLTSLCLRAPAGSHVDY